MVDLSPGADAIERKSIVLHICRKACAGAIDDQEVYLPGVIARVVSAIVLVALHLIHLRHSVSCTTDGCLPIDDQPAPVAGKIVPLVRAQDYRLLSRTEDPNLCPLLDEDVLIEAGHRGDHRSPFYGQCGSHSDTDGSLEVVFPCAEYKVLRDVSDENCLATLAIGQGVVGIHFAPGEEDKNC